MNIITRIKQKITSFFFGFGYKFDWLKIYFSPFKRPNVFFYFGKIAYGTPVFYPRVWKKMSYSVRYEKAEKELNKRIDLAKRNNSEMPTETLDMIAERIKDNLMAYPKKIGFDFVPLGWKTKWSTSDIRFEWNPLWSFVFFKWQFAIIFTGAKPKSEFQDAYLVDDLYWEMWVYYSKCSDKTKSKIERVKETFDWSGWKRKHQIKNMLFKKKYVNELIEVDI